MLVYNYEPTFRLKRDAQYWNAVSRSMHNFFRTTDSDISNRKLDKVDFRLLINHDSNGYSFNLVIETVEYLYFQEECSS